MCSHIHFLSLCIVLRKTETVVLILAGHYFRNSSYNLTKSDKILQRCQAVWITNWFEAPQKRTATCKYSGISIHNDDKY